MRIKDLILHSIRNLWRRKLRTSLTIIGVVIGTASIVLMMSLGIAMNQNFMNQIEQMGSLTTINVYPSYNWEGGGEVNWEDNQIKASDVDMFKGIEHVAVASPIIETSLKMVSGKYVAWINLRGIDPQILIEQNVELSDGRMLEEGDRLAFLFGQEVGYQFYNPTDNGGGMWWGGGYEEERDPPPVDVMNDRLKASVDMSYGDPQQPGVSNANPVRPYTVTAVGIIKGQGDNAYSVYTTLEQARSILKDQERYNQGQNGGNNNNVSGKKEESYNSAIIQVDDMDNVQQVLDEVKAMGFEAYGLMEYLESMQSQAQIIQMVLGGIGAISLLVAAIGITNTMIMSIYERTKEIGVMKVIGARLKDIKKMFLIEAAMIGFFGGLFGLIFSFGGSMLMNAIGQNFSLFGGGYYMDDGGTKLSVIPLWLYLMAISFTTIVGLVSGYLPAVRAMKLSVLSALRTE